MSDSSTRPTLNLPCLYPDLTLCQRTCATQRNLAVVPKLPFPKPILDWLVCKPEGRKSNKGSRKGGQWQSHKTGHFKHSLSWTQWWVCFCEDRIESPLRVQGLLRRLTVHIMKKSRDAFQIFLHQDKLIFLFIFQQAISKYSYIIYLCKTKCRGNKMSFMQCIFQ